MASGAASLQPHTRWLAGRMLQSGVVQVSLNAIEERFGRLMLYPRRDWRLSDLCDAFLHPSDLTRSFLWRCRVAGASYVVPVDPAYPHPPPRNDPWGPATYWHRPQNRKIRHVYERILRHHPSGTLLDVGANWGHHSVPFRSERISLRLFRAAVRLPRFHRTCASAEWIPQYCRRQLSGGR